MYFVCFEKVSYQAYWLYLYFVVRKLTEGLKHVELLCNDVNNGEETNSIDWGAKVLLMANMSLVTRVVHQEINITVSVFKINGTIDFIMFQRSLILMDFTTTVYFLNPYHYVLPDFIYFVFDDDASYILFISTCTIGIGNKQHGFYIFCFKTGYAE